jgi:hypothetical protein
MKSAAAREPDAWFLARPIWVGRANWPLWVRRWLGGSVGEVMDEDSRARWQCVETLTADDVEAMRRELPPEAVEAHLRWLETGEGSPWGESPD